MKWWQRISIGIVLAIAVFGAMIWRSLQPPAPMRPDATEFTLRDMVVINPGKEHRTQQSLRVTHGIIQPANTTEVESIQSYRGMYVLPGLIDMHAHLPPNNALKLTPQVLLLYLAHGVTTIRDAGDIDGTALTGLAASRDGGYQAPRIFPCGPYVSAGKAKWRNTILMTDASQADALVEQLKAKGMSCIKAYDGLTLPMVDALRAAAEKYGLQLIGHVPETLSFESALLPDTQHLMGVTSPRKSNERHLMLIDGWDGVDEARLGEIVDATARHSLAHTPTLVLGRQLMLMQNYDQAKEAPEFKLLPRFFRDVVWNPVEGIAQYRHLQATDFLQLESANAKRTKLVRLLYDAHSRLYLGTDTQQPFVVAGFALQQEIGFFERAGIPLERIWEMATREAGATLNLPLLGSLEVGAPADFIIFRDDPTKSLAALTTIEAVVTQGALYSRKTIDAKLAEYRERQEGFLYDRLSMLLAKAALRRTIAE